MKAAGLKLTVHAIAEAYPADGDTLEQCLEAVKREAGNKVVRIDRVKGCVVVVDVTQETIYGK